MATFYKIDSRSSLEKSADSTGGGGWDSTVWPEEDSTSTQETTFRITSSRSMIPHLDNPFDSTYGYVDYEQFSDPAVFQCPAGYLAYFTNARLSYTIPYGAGQDFAYGDSTVALTWAKFKFFVTGVPLDTTSSVWAPTPWMIDLTGVPGQTVSQYYSILSPLNRPMYPGESVDLRVLPFDGPVNYASVMYEGYLVATDSTAY